MEADGTVTNSTGVRANDDGATAASANDSTTSAARRAVEGVADAAAPALDQLAGGIHRALDRVAGTAAQAAGSLEASGRQLCSAGARLTQRCGARMRDKPMSSLGLAAGAGLLLGWLLSRR